MTKNLMEEVIARKLTEGPEDADEVARNMELGSMRAYKNEDGYTIFFSDAYIEIEKDGKIVTEFHPEEIVLDN